MRSSLHRLEVSMCLSDPTIDRDSSENDEVKSGAEKLTVLVEVTDTGPGIAEADGAKLFNRFTQATRRVGDKYQGSGLGLAICKQFAELMNGTVWFTSEVGKGTTFHVALGLARAPETSIEPEASAQPAPTVTIDSSAIPTHGSFEQLYVLIVEDNIMNQKILARILNKAGARTAVANHGGEALEMMESNAFDLVFMDVQMPVMDGLEATRAIREREKSLRLPPVPIVGVSADARAEHTYIAMSAGMNDYVTKPYQKESIINLLTKYTLAPH
jgi:CheY-like chemotaxis protein